MGAERRLLPGAIGKRRIVGDEFIREGIRSFLDEVLGDYDPFYVHKHDMCTLLII